ncbi:MAG: prolyl-tRNA synthetase associated domain-containing protein [Clostridium sp.]|nr:prolyl-tRNA synthetase associated domain-containing protein [Clostridium sp.]
MLFISEIKENSPETFESELREKVYHVLHHLNIPFQRVDTDEVITMEDCTEINKKLGMEMVKTLFLCNRQQTEYYLFITKGNKPFRSKDFSSALGISRVSFAPAEKMEEMLGTKIGAATVFSILLDEAGKVFVVIDKEVAMNEWYGCSDGVTTGYMKLKTEHVIQKFLRYAKHEAKIIEV